MDVGHDRFDFHCVSDLSTLPRACYTLSTIDGYDATQAAKVDRLKEGSAEFATMRQLAMRFRGLLKGSDPAPLESWLSDAAGSGIHAMRQFAATLRQDLAAVRNAISEPWSNGQAEGQINRLKTLKRAMYGRAGVELLRARMLPLPTIGDHRV